MNTPLYPFPPEFFSGLSKKQQNPYSPLTCRELTCIIVLGLDFPVVTMGCDLHRQGDHSHLLKDSENHLQMQFPTPRRRLKGAMLSEPKASYGFSPLSYKLLSTQHASQPGRPWFPFSQSDCNFHSHIWVFPLANFSALSGFSSRNCQTSESHCLAKWNWGRAMNYRAKHTDTGFRHGQSPSLQLQPQ